MSLITDRIMKIRHFQLLGFMSNALALPAAGIFSFFALIVLAAGRLSTTNFYGSAVCVTVSDVLKYLAADKCMQRMNQ